jgi:dienelactone hydrolase
MIRRSLLITGLAMTGLALAAFFAIASILASGSEAAAPDLNGHVTISFPEAVEGPAPAVLLLSGCGGVRQVQTDYAAVANEAGWAAVIVDSFSARGIDRLEARATVCTALRMTGSDRAQDIYAALAMLRADERIDADRFALIGWSHGGWAILDAMAIAEAGEAPDGALAGVCGAFAIYPYCGFLSHADNNALGDDIALTVLNVGRDRVVNPQACRDMAAARRAEGTPITVIEEPELTHAFDAEDQPWDPRMRYDAEGTRRNHERFAAFLDGLEG